jgi:hypothetical protein
MKSEEGSKALAEALNLDQDLVDEAVRNGTWDELRKHYRSQIYRGYIKDRIDQLEWRQELISRLEAVELAGLDATLRNMQDQLESKGHLFLLDEDGEVRKDAHNNPIVRRVPKEMKEALQLTEKLREENTKALVGVVMKTPQLTSNEVKKLEDPNSIVDVDLLFAEKQEADDGDK